MTANFASHLRLELSVEQVDYHRLISQNMVLPSLFGNFIVRSAITVLKFHIRLVGNSVQIFMKAVQKKGQKFLGVLLLETSKMRPVTTNRPSKSNGGDGFHITRPHIFDQIAKSLGNVAFHAQRIGPVELVEVAVTLKVFGEYFCG